MALGRGKSNTSTRPMIRGKRSSRRSLLHAHREGGSALAVRTGIFHRGDPVASHLRFDGGAILSWNAGRLDGGGIVHGHSRHVHIERELYIANIDQLAAPAKFDRDF